jgi:phosphate-selective porin OprO/OprP
VAGSYFRAIVPNKSFWEGGLGAWEIVLRLSYSDLDSGPVRGGRFWRLTPQLNWYLNQNVRLEANYGYSRLYRFGLTGITQFFQLRLQTQL